MIMPLQPPKDEKQCSYPDCSIHSSCIGECELTTQSETITELMALKSELTGDLVTARAKCATLREALVKAERWAGVAHQSCMGLGSKQQLGETLCGLHNYLAEQVKGFAATGDE